MSYFGDVGLSMGVDAVLEEPFWPERKQAVSRFWQAEQRGDCSSHWGKVRRC